MVSLLPVLHCYKNGCYEKHSRLQLSGRHNLILKLLCSVDSRGSQLESEGKTRVMLVGRLEALQTSSTPWGYLPKNALVAQQNLDTSPEILNSLMPLINDLVRS